ncbi:sensor histidine kinase [Undibacterium sp. TJN19]|uniref:sensor histidine kinase n=1 Tax=Undibacterium sp. TJN19 TaxID=3413055 RepID=UPI003BF256CA
MSNAFIKKLSPPWVPARYGNAPYFWLLSFAMFAWKYLYMPLTGSEILLLAVSFLFFLPIYFYSFWISGWRIYLCILINCALGIAWARYNFGSSVFCIFAATMCSRIHNSRKAYEGLAAVALIVAAASFLMRLETYFWIPALIFSIPSGLGAIIGERLASSNASLLKKQEEVEYLAALAERERIARDLHDLLGHTLSVITLKAELAGKLMDRNPVACKKEIYDIEHTARQALAEVRAAVVGYRATGLAHELQSAKSVLDAAQVELRTEIDQLTLPPAVENVMALAVREAITNIIRHAKASQCEIKLSQGNGLARLEISDNGNTSHIDKLSKGNGLNGMTERVQALGGKLDLFVTQGLRIELSLPMKELI